MLLTHSFVFKLIIDFYDIRGASWSRDKEWKNTNEKCKSISKEA